MGQIYLKTCNGCGINYTTIARDRNKKYHSAECYKASIKKKENVCLNCGSVTLSPKFCCKSCSATFNNLQRDESVNRGPAKLEFTKIRQCQFCQKWHSKITSKYCSKDCLTVSRLTKAETNEKRKYGPKSQRPNSKDKILACGPYTRIIYNICAYSKETFISYRRFKYSPKFKNLYSREGKAAYKFMFNIFDYPNLFDLSLLEKYGWFSTGRKGKSKNPNGVSRDHRVSVSEATKNGYDPYYITHPLNCELMLHSENKKKYTKSSIKYEELVQLVKDYENGSVYPIRTDGGNIIPSRS